MNNKLVKELEGLWNAVDAWAENQKFCFDCRCELTKHRVGLIRPYGTVYVCTDCDGKALKRNRVKKILQPIYDIMMKDKNT